MRFLHHIALLSALLIAPVYLNLAMAQSTTGTIAGNITGSSSISLQAAYVGTLISTFRGGCRSGQRGRCCPRNSFDGTAGRGIMSGPGLKNVDMGIYRGFHIMEAKTRAFHLEMTNAFNLVNLSNSSTGSNSAGTFGRIRTANALRLVQMAPRARF